MPENQAKVKVVKTPELVRICRSYLFDFAATVQTFNSLYTELQKLVKDADKNFELQLRKTSSKLEEAKKSKNNLGINQLLKVITHTSHLNRVRNISSSNLRIFTNSFFVNLFSRFDAFLIDLIRYHYKETDAILHSTNQLSFADLQSSGAKTISQVKERYIDEEIETLRANRINQIKFLEKIVERDIMPNIKESIPVFKEAYERRNIIVHHNGIITNHYRDVRKKLKLKEIPKQHNRIKITHDYFTSVYSCLLNISLEVIFAVNHKPKNRESMVQNALTDLVIENIRTGNYELAQMALEIIHKYGLEDNFYYINLALCLKKRGRRSKAIESIKNIRISPGQDEYKIFEIAAALLSDNPFDALKVIDDITSWQQSVVIKAELEAEVTLSLKILFRHLNTKAKLLMLKDAYKIRKKGQNVKLSKVIVIPYYKY